MHKNVFKINKIIENQQIARKKIVQNITKWVSICISRKNKAISNIFIFLALYFLRYCISYICNCIISIFCQNLTGVKFYARQISGKFFFSRFFQPKHGFLTGRKAKKFNFRQIRRWVPLPQLIIIFSLILYHFFPITTQSFSHSLLRAPF